jgi:hypothetical protein
MPTPDYPSEVAVAADEPAEAQSSDRLADDELADDELADDEEADDEEAADEAGAPSGRPARADELWADVNISVLEIALPDGVGYTLRAYRPAQDVTAGEAAVTDLDEFDAASAAVAQERARRKRDDDSDDETDDEAPVDELEDGAEEPDLAEEPSEEDFAAEDEEVGEEDEVPVFLARKGRVILFHSPDKLVEFVRSGAEHDLSALDSWPRLVERITVDDVAPLDEDTYELDLLVENLRGGADAWDGTLILRAGEIARDLGHALRIDTVQVALAPGSPLDDLDDTLRAAERGGLGGVFARRRLRKVPAQQTTLTWRRIITKISAVADWRD